MALQWVRILGTRRRVWLASLLTIAVAAAGFAVLRAAPDARTALRSGDFRAAHAALREAAERGDPWAQNALGNLYYLGLGIETDYRAALDWYWRSAAQGHAAAQVNMGHLYAQGLGVAKDPIRAFAWYRHAEQAGSEAAEGRQRLIAGSLQMTPNQVQRAREQYRTTEDLRP